MLKLYISLLVLPVVLLISAACGGEAASTPTSTATPTSPTQVAPMPTAMPTPTATMIQTAPSSPGSLKQRINPLDELQKYLGSYRHEERKFDVKLVIRNNHHAIDVPGQRVVGLYPPDEWSKWVLRPIDGMAVGGKESAVGV